MTVFYLAENLVSRKERIDALELLGATFVDKKRDMLGSYKLWKRAMEERYVSLRLIIHYIRFTTVLCSMLFNNQSDSFHSSLYTVKVEDTTRK